MTQRSGSYLPISLLWIHHSWCIYEVCQWIRIELYDGDVASDSWQRTRDCAVSPCLAILLFVTISPESIDQSRLSCAMWSGTKNSIHRRRIRYTRIRDTDKSPRKRQVSSWLEADACMPSSPRLVSWRSGVGKTCVRDADDHGNKRSIFFDIDNAAGLQARRQKSRDPDAVGCVGEKYFVIPENAMTECQRIF